MATMSEIISVVQDNVKDSDVATASAIITLTNRCIAEIASRYTLPSLAASASVTSTETYKVALPANFGKRLYHCFNTTQSSECAIYDSYYDFVVKHPVPTSTAAQPVTVVVPYSGYLYYQGIPTDAETLTLYYYRVPTATGTTTGTYETVVPDGIPGAINDMVLTNYVSWKLFSKIEQGLEGNKSDTMYYRQLYNEGLTYLFDHMAQENPGIVGGDFGA